MAANRIRRHHLCSRLSVPRFIGTCAAYPAPGLEHDLPEDNTPELAPRENIHRDRSRIPCKCFILVGLSGGPAGIRTPNQGIMSRDATLYVVDIKENDSED
jgi:hypothetical protein